MHLDLLLVIVCLFPLQVLIFMSEDQYETKQQKEIKQRKLDDEIEYAKLMAQHRSLLK